MPGVIPSDHNRAMAAARRRRIGTMIQVQAAANPRGPLAERLAAVVDHFFDTSPMPGVAAVCGFVARLSLLAGVRSAGRCPACERVVAERGLTEE